MISGIAGIALRSVKFYRKQILYQFLIITLLCAVITGSLLTGSSVRSSLEKISAGKLGSTRFLISSGIRYFNPALAAELSEHFNCSGFLELKGTATNLISQALINNVNIFCTDSSFFPFLTNDSFHIAPGTILINSTLAEQLNILENDEIIMKFRPVTDIPSDAPFAPSNEDLESIVLKVGKIISENEGGNFSVQISQITPLNLFVNSIDVERITAKKLKYNRIIIKDDNGLDSGKINEILRNVLKPSHIGLSTRVSANTGEAELISNRVFIDSALSGRIISKFSGASPVVTYLANNISFREKSTPYSFVSALSPSMYKEIPADDCILINSWLADDLGAKTGDSLLLTWYAPDSLNKLKENQKYFVVKNVVSADTGIWSDQLLMPEFPGISGKESCSQWEAGITIDMRNIRSKDEDYWNKYRGTPKGFINYETGKKIWGNNFGPVTSIRFKKGINEKDILKNLDGSLDPALTGFMVSDILNDSINAAQKSVDFGTLFISLGFFLIVASFILLWLTVSHDVEMRKPVSVTLFSTGFRKSSIRLVFLTEFYSVAFAGCIAGSLAGMLINVFIIKALNSVWIGAVQTNTITSSVELSTIFTGFIACFIIVCLFLLIIVSLHVNGLFRHRKNKPFYMPSRSVRMLAGVSLIATIILFIFSFFDKDNQVTLSFITGAMLMFSSIISFRAFLTGNHINRTKLRFRDLSAKYYSMAPINGVLPVLLIATGIFSFMITVVNKKDFSSLTSDRSSGTGGFRYWIESSIPVSEDLSSKEGIQDLGLDEAELIGLKFVQLKKMEGNDASCLNLNHITTPPILGVEPDQMISRGAFSFAVSIDKGKDKNPWEYLNSEPGKHIIYGIADQTVLDWGLKISVGDTLILRAENGQPLKIIIAAGLKSSVFQGNLLIGKDQFLKYFPSVPGSEVILADAATSVPDTAMLLLQERLSSYGASVTETSDRLASFYQITNTYLSVFGVFGGLGLVIGVAGLGFVLLRNYNSRKKEFALMIATGFTFRKVRLMILSEQVVILFAGVITGIISAVVATLPSLLSNNAVPWIYIFSMIALIVTSGILALWLSVRAIEKTSLVSSLKKE
ncbi:MAG TPA: ABC transporter permease [Bacteroidales bacterium]|nr:ABC transporter permease [Bacteroidales bacterium]